MKHQSPAVRCSTLALVALVTLLACTAASAQNRLVSTNPHEPNLRSGSTPPMSYLASMTDSSATAYHVSSGTEVTRALAYNTYGKPKIISDDSGAATPTNAIAWINQVCAAGQHYEHYDLALGSSAYGYRATNGQLIDRLNDFPSPSQQVLAHIRDNSCASNLAAYGTLSVVNGQFRWNGQPVQLVGHSWMGALAGKNFDIVGNPAQGIPGYLGVLEDHRVNLTRVWVIEQWTGLLVNKPGFPHQSNVELPFTGSIDFSGSNDTLNLFAIDPAFLNRLRLFVDTAWAKGIVVQITLFDRHGLLNNAGEYGRWLGSPYNVNNNADSVLLAAGAAGKAPASFPTICGTPPCGIGESHRLLIEAIVQELDGRGNVIFEIMNEPLSTEWNELVFAKWNSWVAKTVKNAP